MAFLHAFCVDIYLHKEFGTDAVPTSAVRGKGGCYPNGCHTTLGCRAKIRLQLVMLQKLTNHLMGFPVTIPQ